MAHLVFLVKGSDRGMSSRRGAQSSRLVPTAADVLPLAAADTPGGRGDIGASVGAAAVEPDANHGSQLVAVEAAGKETAADVQMADVTAAAAADTWRHLVENTIPGAHPP